VQSVEFSSGSVEGVAFLKIFDSLVIRFGHFQLVDTGNGGWFEFLVRSAVFAGVVRGFCRSGGMMATESPKELGNQGGGEIISPIYNKILYRHLKVLQNDPRYPSLEKNTRRIFQPPI
jgi:hypothetical protein